MLVITRYTNKKTPLRRSHILHELVFVEKEGTDQCVYKIKGAHHVPNSKPPVTELGQAARQQQNT